MFSIIHEVADPQTIKTTSLRNDAHVFQKCPNALTKPDLGVSKQGSSSMYITRLPLY
jgi:hypothetical protein